MDFLDAEYEEAVGGGGVLDGEYGPCPCGECSTPKHPAYTAKSKGLPTALKNARAFFFKSKETTYFVDGGHNVWVKGPDGKYNERVGRFVDISSQKPAAPRPRKNKKAPKARKVTKKKED